MTVRFGRAFAVLGAAALLMVGAPSQDTAAQGVATSLPGTWGTAINIQNTGSEAASATVDFYNAQGSMETSFPITSIAAGAQRSFYVPAEVQDLPSGGYSAVVNATEPVRVIVNSGSTNPYTGYSYSGVNPEDASNTLYFPGLYKSFYGFSSEFVIQNTSSSEVANVTAEFYHTDPATGVSARVGAPVPLGAIPANASRTFPLADQASLPGGNIGEYAAKITSTGGAIAGIANSGTEDFNRGASSYNAITEGSNVAYAPTLLKCFYGFVSAIVVQNVDAVDADVTLTYSNGETEEFTLKPNAYRSFSQLLDDDLPSGDTRGIFSARVESDGGKIVAIVNEANSGAQSKPACPDGRPGDGAFASYNAPSEASTATNSPIVMSKFFGYFTTVTVQNVGDAPTSIKVTYGNGTTKTFGPIPANGTLIVSQLAGTNGALPDNTVTSATIESTTDEQIVTVVNENTHNSYGDKYLYGQNPGDWLFSYTSFVR